ncbi:MAG: aldehyde dehydrogenase family protein, partial [Oscillospiraceae bacterium]|nr:aldehyde dehydrogenase family protein [Oscillospiraceae bacterium]
MDAYTKQYIGGEWRTGSGERILSNFNPYSGELLYTYRSAAEKDVDDAYIAAKKAQEAWANTSPEEVRGYFEALVSAIVEKEDDIRYWLRAESGSTAPKVDFEFHTVI